MIRKARRLVILGFLIAPLSVFASPTLLVSGTGELSGALNINVAGIFYDVAFGIGFAGGDEPSDFPFDEGGALLAAQALLDQVLVDIPAVGYLFDSRPDLTSGCGPTDPTFEPQCYIITPYPGAWIGFGPPTVSFAVNFSGSTASSDSSGLIGVFEFDYPVPTTTAFWSRSAVDQVNVPEPGTLALLGLGLAGMGFARRKKA